MLLEYLKSHVALLVTLILVVIIVAAFVVWLVYLFYKRKKEQNKSEITQEDETEKNEEEAQEQETVAPEVEEKAEPLEDAEEDDMKKETSEKTEKKNEPKAKTAQKPQILGKWALFEEDRGGFGFKLLASNGEVMLKSSSPYASLQSAKAGIKTYQDNIASGRLEIVETKKGNFFVQINNASGRMLATSADYSTRSSCESALQSIKRWAQTSTIVQEENEEK